MTLYHRTSGQYIFGLLRVPRQDRANGVHKDLSNYSWKNYSESSYRHEAGFESNFCDYCHMCLAVWTHGDGNRTTSNRSKYWVNHIRWLLQLYRDIADWFDNITVDSCNCFWKKPLIHCLVYFKPDFDLQTAAIPNNTNDDLQKGYHTWCCLNLSTDSSHYVSFIPWSVRIPLSVNTGYSIFLVQLWKDKHTEFWLGAKFFWMVAIQGDTVYHVREY